MAIGVKLCFLLLLVTTWSSHVSSQSIFSGWTKKQADVYFLLDSSSSVWIVDYKKMLDFVQALVADMDIGPRKTRVGVGVYSINFHEYLPIDNDRSKPDLLRAIDDTPYIMGNTYISRAIHGVRTVGLSPAKARKGVPLIAVLITDGSSRYRQLTVVNATLAKQEGITMFSIGVGWDVDRDELRSIASDPKSEFNFLVESFGSLITLKNDLSRKMAAVDYLQKDQRGICGGDQEADILFVFDEAAIGKAGSGKIKAFIADVVGDLSVNSGRVRVGVISKTCKEGKDVRLDSYLSTNDFKFGLLNNDDGPGLADLLRRAWFEGFQVANGARQQAKRRVVLILTETLSADSPLPAIAYMAKVNALVEIFVIRIGSNYNKATLNTIATSDKHITYFDSTSFLERGRPEFFTNFCEGL